MLTRFYALLLTAVFLFSGFSQPVLAQTGPPALTLEAEGAILVDPLTGQVLFEQDADKKWYPASMTKIMTMGLVLEALEAGTISLDDQVVTSEHAAGYGGTQVYLEPGEKFTLEEMLIAISVGSANDASAAVAEFMSGSEEAFAQRMTEKAKELGCTNTNFVNAHGLHDDNHYTTPRDMALISQWAMSFPMMRELTGIKEYTFRPEPKLLILYNTNKLLWWYPGTTGLKTGTTSAAKRNLTATAERSGVELLSVVMGVDRKNGHFGETMKLLNWGFASFKFEQFYDKGDLVQEIKVSKGVKDTIPLVAGQKVGALIGKHDQPELEVKIEVPDSVAAPVELGQEIGRVIVLNNGVEVNSVPLLAGEEVERSSFWQLFGKSLNRTMSF
ncbi:MAG: D-alanyl-D-alanine carboxypeptidase [Clostridia bacterium]|jgi:D-alanyl-D-alanine carboxypeptidase (penicillin-binding protein 5/6)|nr:D-alanyl-D-alanine carboxypeptidase [Clostridia bacterium]